jgi:type I restriction enzyme, R subunit
LKIEGNKVQQMINDIIRASKISTLIEQRPVTDETFLSDVLKETKNRKARTALVKNKVRQIIEEKAHLNPVYYEKMKERLEAIIRDERKERREDADYFNRYEKILKDLYGQEEERKKLGFTSAFEFAVYETLLKEFDDENISKDITKKIFEGIKEEITNIPDWQNKLTSQKKLESTIYDILNETGIKKIENNIDEIIKQVIMLAKRNLE